MTFAIYIGLVATRIYAMNADMFAIGIKFAAVLGAL